MDEMIAGVSTVMVATITAVVTLVAAIKDRSGIHHLEKLGVVINTMRPTSVQRKMLESIRDEAATEWGIKALGRQEKKKLRWTLYGLLLIFIAIFVWELSYILLPWAWIPRPPEWGDWVMWAAYVAWVVVYSVRLNRLREWERSERARRKLPEKT